jgi:hypothetical protein
VNETDWLAGVTVSCPGRIETERTCSTDATFVLLLPGVPVFPVVPVLSPSVVEVVEPFAAGCWLLPSVYVTETLVGPPDEDSAPRAIAPPRNKIGAVMPTAVAIAPARARRDFFPSPMPFPRQLGTLA